MKYFIYKHELDCDDHGFFTGWEVLSETTLNEYKENLKNYKKAFDAGFEYEFYFADYDTTLSYKDINKLLKNNQEIPEADYNTLTKYVDNCKWNKITDIFNEIEDQLSNWEDDNLECDEEEDEDVDVIEVKTFNPPKNYYLCSSCMSKLTDDTLTVCPKCGESLL